MIMHMMVFVTSILSSSNSYLFTSLNLCLQKEMSEPGEKQSSGAADVVTLGDAWLSPAIQKQLIQPIPNAEHSR